MIYRYINHFFKGNYDLNTDPKIVANWVMSMLYNYLKSDQTMRLNPSFGIQIKILSVAHTESLKKKKKQFRQHIFKSPFYH